MAQTPRAMLTGVTGQDGSYLAELLLDRGYEVTGIARGPASDRWRIAHLSQLTVLTENLLEPGIIAKLINDVKPNEIYNLSAVSSIAESKAHPELTEKINGDLVAELLAAIRASGSPIRFCQASSAEIFGRPAHAPQTELTPLRPEGPYAVAKAAGHQAVIDYRERHGLFAASAILYNHESPRRGLEFVSRKVTSTVARIKRGLAHELVLGSLDAKRDWGFAGDYVRAMWLMLNHSTAGDFVVATGQTHSVRDLVEAAFSHAGLDWRDFVRVDQSLSRPPELVARVGDASKALQQLGWSPTIGFAELVAMMVDADLERLS